MTMDLYSSWWSTHLKNMIVKLDHSPRDRDENKKYLSCHHLVLFDSPPRWVNWMTPHQTETF